ncbi:hypothetical protein D3C78_1761890 [compost metagenome]
MNTEPLLGVLDADMVGRPTVITERWHQALELQIAPRLQPYLAASGNHVAWLLRRTLRFVRQSDKLLEQHQPAIGRFVTEKA